MRHDETDAERIIRVEGDIASLKGSVSSIQGTLASMNSTLSNIGKPNYFLWVSAMGVALTVFTLATGGLFYFMKSEITNQVTPVSIKAAASETDRHKLNDQVYRNVADVAEIRQQLMVEKERGTERETQNRAIAQFANMRQAQNSQLFGLLWRRTYGEPLPLNTFYPDISFSKAHGN